MIKKVMEMDEAVPFNASVDPVSQGIPVSVNCYFLLCLSWMSVNFVKHVILW